MDTLLLPGLETPSRRGLRQFDKLTRHRAYAVGPQYGADGTTPPTGRQGKSGAAIVGQVHGKHYESTSRGLVFCVQEQGSGTAPGTALGTTAMFALHNPPGSGKLVSILKVSLGYISGTLGAGTVYHCANTAAATAATGALTAPSGGTALTVYNRGIRGEPLLASDVPVGVAKVGSTVVAPVAIGVFCSLQASLASTAVGPWQMIEDVDGAIVIFPGFTYQLQAVAAAGSSPLVSPGCVWEELPLR